MNSKVINIDTDFSKFPSGRFVTDGPYSGELFRDSMLVPALKNFDQVIVNIDNTRGYGSSFLEESFGGLIREHGFTLDEIKSKLKIIATQDGFDDFEKSIYEHLEAAEKVRLANAV